jgi:hypothetical protein
MPSVTIKRVRSWPRTTRKLVMRPTVAATVAAVFGQQARGIGADAEIRGVAERNDARVAQDQIEGQREEPGDEDLAA